MEKYFLSARIPDNTAYKTLDREVKSLGIDVNMQDVESRLSRRMADFYEIVDRLNMEDIVQAEPKKVVGYLVEALRAPAFKSAVNDQLGRQAHKPTKNNIQLFLKWLRASSPSPTEQHQIGVSPPTAGGHLKKLRGGNQNVAKHASGGTGQQNNQPGRSKRKCPEVSVPAEVKGFYEKETGKKAGSKLEKQDLPKLSVVIGIGDKPVFQDCLPVGVGGLLVLRNIMGRLGYSSKELLAEAQSLQEIWDMEDADDDRSRSLVRVLAYSGSAQVPEPTAEELQLQEEEDCACFANLDDSDKQDGRDVIAVLEEKIKEVQEAGATSEYADQLRTILMKYRDGFRVKIGKDLPVDMPTMEITLKPGAVLIKCRARRYSPEHRAFLEKHVQELLEAGLCFGADVFNNDLLNWIDDLLGYEANDDQLLKLLVRVLEICASKGLKLNPTICAFYLREALWCRRVVSGKDVKHDRARIEALMNLPPPMSGNKLQQFICALNWMRNSIPAYNKLVHPLVLQMEKVYKRAGGRTDQLFERCKSALGNALELAHPDPAKRLCVFTDASEDHWGAAVTQIQQDQQLRPLSEQEHEPLMMLSGTFLGSAKRWAILEKEAFAIVETCRRADYLLHRSDGFALFTDHRNLRYIFYPHGVSNTVPKYTADNLHRWSLWHTDMTSMTSQGKKIYVRISYHGGAALSNEAADLQVRICVVGHFGIAGHRTLAPTLEKIGEGFTWIGMKSDIEYFVRRCLHCTSSLGGSPHPCVLGEAMYAENPNELIHREYLFTEESTTGEIYVLVIKDDASKYVWLLPCKSAVAEAAYNDLLDCAAARYGRASPLHHCAVPVGKWHGSGGYARSTAVPPGITIGA
ncbi:hypothetical protein ON010_g12746 [Phytophthora cinnamomi]|nr:hypothetical protein ON010_g12746 [Phytophthora cinnamomi]